MDETALATYRRYWLPELVIVLLLMLLTTVVFWNSDLDLRMARLFYDATNPEQSWPTGQNSLWQFLYDSAPTATGILVVGALLVAIGASLSERLRRLRIYAVFILAAVVVGPGLVVNSIFKDHWGRPRPRQVIEFGGDLEYLPPLMKGQSGQGRSFPSGHSSVGFVFAAFWFIWRRRRLPWALAALGFALTYGGLLGTARMVAGGHFLSDVLWSAYLTFLTSLLLYYFVLRIPQREQRAADEMTTAT
ncbi:MAG: hypothetical protein AMJ69_08705 [Gammaproteobacteria bacterium SG8_47]|nr:MAG: hypothetical protein AMJ69_08705 [Gammaproteobacteria bacterium SG8_47]